MRKNDPECRKALEKRCAGRSRAEVGRELGIADGTLYDALNGGVSTPTWSRIRTALGIPLKRDTRVTLHIKPATYERLQAQRGDWTWDNYLNYLIVITEEARGGVHALSATQAIPPDYQLQKDK
jgi:hypothetical protein